MATKGPGRPERAGLVCGPLAGEGGARALLRMRLLAKPRLRGLLTTWGSKRGGVNRAGPGR